ncbi:uncharacterized protein IL334_007357 [Kwoniella shivajii]|uniref:Uncharacterized protein n=1 Tax=Kwoniella shivajii TaxID=564305 RepID=A0ABZ1D8F4_9TREE|nr:hypothetical protein IL334_007357 [Kwoniella shivajii]
MINGDTAPQLITLTPPRPPSDLIASALFLPLNEISPTHGGRKLRFVGQILAFHSPTSLLLLTSYPNSQTPNSPSPTILVDISTPLLGQSPSVKDISAVQDSMYSRNPQPPSPVMMTGKEGNYVNREMLSLSRGEWVSLVGWLEGDGSKMVRKVKTSSSYLKPLPLILQAIHISSSRPPPINGLHRGSVLPWNGERYTKDEVGFTDEADTELEDSTPRPSKTRLAT